jgi:uncharacterized SAM-dependent methyltransferase
MAQGLPPFRITVLREEAGAAAVDELRQDVLAGMAKPINSKTIPSKYFYDDAGSRMYPEVEICSSRCATFQCMVHAGLFPH